MKNFLLICSFLMSANLISQPLSPPTAHRDSVVDTLFNRVIVDEYRWMENADESPYFEDWMDAQATLTKKSLNKASFQCDSYNAIDKYLLTNYSHPRKEGDYYFIYSFFDNVSLPALFVQNTFRDDPTMLVDPNFISRKDKILLKGYWVSLDSKYLAYQFSRNGSDWAEIRVVNIGTGIHKPDELVNVKFSNIAWKGDGFYYSTFLNNGSGIATGQEVMYHVLGTKQSDDQVVFKRENNPSAHFNVSTTSDERFLFLKEIDEDKGLINIFYIDFQSAIHSLRPLLTRLTNSDNVQIIDNHGDEIIAISHKNANNGMVIKINPQNPRVWDLVIPEYEQSLLLEVKLLEDKILTVYQTNGKQQIIFFDYQGQVLHAIQIGYGFSVSGFNGLKTDKKILFSYEGYAMPKIVYILDTENYKIKPLKATVINFDHSLFETKELEYTSFDGTKVPMFMMYKKDIDLHGNNPALLEAYGGFGSIEMATFSPGIVHFLMRGGIYVYANIRGGGDKGLTWAKQGRGLNKKNSFDDFIAAAEFLIEENYTSPQKLAITGASNGGLVVGVAMTQRPELFKVAVPIVAPFDMVRFEKYTVGHWHTDEYGSVSDSAGFQLLMDYSPLHNIKDTVNYPATLIMTSDNDDRVMPFHSYKFAAKLQNRAAQTNPVLLRVEREAGHYGAQSSFKKVIQEDADIYDFILYHLNEKNSTDH